VNSWGICPGVMTGLFHLAECPQESSVLYMADFPSFLRPSAPLYGETTFCLSIQPSLGTWAMSTL
jgi:hypothetical protein